MKKNIYIISMLISLVLFSNCSSSDDSSSQKNETSQKLTGKWYFDDPSTKPTINNSFTFTSNGQVTYSYWTGKGNNYGSETGTFSIDGSIMKMVFPDTVVLTYIQKLVFVNDKTVQFLATGKANEKPYEGTYYKAD